MIFKKHVFGPIRIHKINLLKKDTRVDFRDTLETKPTYPSVTLRYAEGQRVK